MSQRDAVASTRIALRNRDDTSRAWRIESAAMSRRRRRKLWSSLGTSTEISSPCTGSCTLDELDVCAHCGRTIAEIAGWMDASDEEKAAIKRAAQGRLHAVS
jgi:predicted Fe-S protein YdhL (DUF1289 family)